MGGTLFTTLPGECSRPNGLTVTSSGPPEFFFSPSRTAPPPPPPGMRFCACALKLVFFLVRLIMFLSSTLSGPRLSSSSSMSLPRLPRPLTGAFSISSSLLPPPSSSSSEYLSL